MIRKRHWRFDRPSSSCWPSATHLKHRRRSGSHAILDYHAGRIAFSYLGDIWTVNEDGSAPQRVSDHRGHDIPAFLARRQMDRVLVQPLRQQRRSPSAVGGAPRRLTFHTGTTTWSAGRAIRSTSSSAPRTATARFNVATLYEVPVAAAASSRCRSTGATTAASRPTAGSSPSTVIPRSGRGSIIAAATRRISGRGFTAGRIQAAARRALQPLLADGAPTARSFRRRSAAERQERRAGQPRRAQERQQHLDPSGGGAPVQVTKHVDGNLFWPSMSSDGKVIVYEELFGLWKLDVASGRTSEIRIEIAADEKDNEPTSRS